jgi:hypothetical protein
VHMQASADPGPPPPQHPPADDGAATMTGGQTPELEADVLLANHATPTHPSPQPVRPRHPQVSLALQPTQAAGHGEIHGENEQPNLLNPAPVAPRKARRLASQHQRSSS